MITPDKLESFLTELSELSMKHGVYIWTDGCNEIIRFESFGERMEYREDNYELGHYHFGYYMY